MAAGARVGNAWNISPGPAAEQTEGCEVGTEMTTERGCCFQNEQFGQEVKRTMLVRPQQKPSDYGMDVICM